MKDAFSSLGNAKFFSQGTLDTLGVGGGVEVWREELTDRGCQAPSWRRGVPTGEIALPIGFAWSLWICQQFESPVSTSRLAERKRFLSVIEGWAL